MNIRLGRIGRLLAPGFGQCGRCRTPWRFVRGHTTQYANGSYVTRGCFPLCERCWTELGTAEARMPFYRAMWEGWAADCAAQPHYGAVTPWEQIEAAVFAEEQKA